MTRPAADAARDAAPRARRSRCGAGLHYVYTGNVHDREGDTTCCPSLRRGRDRARLVRDSSPRDMDARCVRDLRHGDRRRFGDAVGSFGRRRMRVVIG